MLRIYYGKVTILLLSAKTLAERRPKNQQNWSGFQSVFFSERRLLLLRNGFLFLFGPHFLIITVGRLFDVFCLHFSLKFLREVGQRDKAIGLAGGFRKGFFAIFSC